MAHDQSKERRRTLLIGVAAGVAAGFGSGLFGIGGGLIVVPILVLILHIDQKTASATSVTSIAVSAAAAAIPFIVEGRVDYLAAGSMFAGAAVGAIVGARLLGRLPAKVVAGVFAAVAAIAAIRLFLSASSPGIEPLDLGGGEIVSLAAVGLVAGVLAALLGVGGGVVYVPAMAILFSAPQHLAQGTSLVTIVPTTAVAAFAHGRAGRVDWPMAGAIATGGLVSGTLSGVLALATAPDLLRRLFAAFLVLVAVRMVLRVRQS